MRLVDATSGFHDRHLLLWFALSLSLVEVGHHRNQEFLLARIQSHCNQEEPTVTVSKLERLFEASLERVVEPKDGLHFCRISVSQR